MKHLLLSVFILFTIPAFADEAKDRLIENQIDSILTESGLSLSERTAVQTLALEKLEEQKQALNGKTEVDEKVFYYTNKAKEYSAFTSALAVKIAESAAETGKTIDQFIDETWIGKLTLITTFAYFGGSFVVHVFVIIFLAFFVTWLLHRIVFILCNDGMKQSEQHIKTYIKKRNFLGRLLFKNPTYEKKVYVNYHLIKSDNIGWAVVWYLLLPVCAISLASVIL